MKISLVLIIYRSDSTIAKETAIYCENIFKNKSIDCIRTNSDFNKRSLENEFNI